MAAEKTIKLEITPAQAEVMQEAMQHYAEYLIKCRVSALVSRELENLRIYVERAKRAA